jgi:NCS1 family nucleobase:cation symporter-1
LLCDYFIVRKRTLSVPGLYAVDGEYSYTGGVNTRAMVALAGGVLVALAGFWVKPLEALYQIAWFTGFGVSFVLYALLMRRHTVG